MKTQTFNAVAYTYNMLTFAFQKTDMIEKVNAIYLFGSAVRGTLTKKSDIDIFFDCDKKDEKLVKRIVDSAVLNFEASQDFEKWKRFNFVYPFSFQNGVLDEWELKSSIASEGIVLYSKKPVMNRGERSVLFVIKYPKQKKEYIRVRRALFGRDETVYKNGGIVQQINGKKLSTNVFIIPQTQQQRIMELLSHKKVEFSMTEIIKT